MHLTLESLEVLDAIARKGSFAAAARELDRVPSALTYTVRKLEGDLDVLLFDRRGHRAVLTPAGQDLLEEGRRLLEAAGALEARVRRVATGWEPELTIACDDLIDPARLFPLLAEFYAEQAAASAAGGSGTRVRITTEVLAGTWDALASGRADLVIGATGEAPAGAGYTQRALGTPEFVFAVAPQHPLARYKPGTPLPDEEVLRYRAVAIGDTSRSLPARSAGLMSGQDVLTVPDLRAKVAAQAAGLGCGFLPLYAALPEVRRKRLVIREVESPRPLGPMAYAWRSRGAGRALRWFTRRLEDARLRAELLQGWL
jgi:DNA-binding transcriptional LysR family regulator